MTDTPTPPTANRRWLLTQNRELRREGIFNWTLPAWAGRFADGRTYNTCPEPGACPAGITAESVFPQGSCRFGAGHRVPFDGPSGPRV